MAVPATPVNFYVQQGNGNVYLSFDLSAGATSYNILRSTDGVTFASVATPAVNSYLDTSVSIGTTYWYQVAAVSSDGSSVFSSAQSIVPTATGDLSLGEIRLAAQQRADRVNSNFVTLPEWNSYINQSRFELYDLLVTLYEDYYLAAPAVFTTSGNVSTYPLPNGTLTFQDENGTDFVPKAFYKLMGVDCGLAPSGNAWVTLGKFDYIERNRYVYPNITGTFAGVFNMRYRIAGSNLLFIPVPSAGQFIRIHYIPRLDTLLADSDIMDGVSGWTEYIIVDAAIKALQKEESDVSVLLAQKQALIERIQSSGMNRDAGQPDTISNTRGWNGKNGGYGGPGWDGGFGGY